MTREIWYAQDGTVLISGATFSAGLIGSDFTHVVKEISITGGGRDVEGVRCMGSGTNFYVFEKGMEMIECSLTTVKPNTHLFRTLASGQATTYPWLLTGDSLRDPVNILYKWTDRYDSAGAEMRIKMATSYCTGKEMSLSVDDHIEETFTFKCAPENYQEEYTLNRTASGCTITV